MKSLSNNRVAAFGMAGALALGTVASVGALAPAGAASTDYTCTLPVLGAKQFPVSGKSPLPAEVLPGEAVPALPAKLGVGLDGGTVGAIVNFLSVTSIAGTITDTALSVGSESVPLTGMEIAPTALTSNVPVKLPVSGTTGSFTAPATLGSYPVALPSTFDFIPVSTDGGTPIVGVVPCALPAGGTAPLGTMKVVDKYSSATKAKLKNAPITRTKHAKIATTVVNGNGAAAAGKVIAKKGSKTLDKGTLSGTGKETLVLPRLKKGVHKIVVKYKGNSTTEASKKVVKFTVR
ncbi:MAG: DUF6801 domain-containing protein [Nocardioides sp.]